MTEPVENTTTETTDDNQNANPEGFLASIDAAFGDLGSIDDVPDPNIETPDDSSEGGSADDGQTPADGDAAADEQDELDIDLDVDVTDWSPEAARAFKNLRADHKKDRQALRELNETLEQREQRIRELETISPEIDQLRSKIQEYETKLLVTRVEDTDAYKMLVEAPLREVMTQSDSLAEKYGIDADALFSAIALQDEAAQEEAISDLLASASERDRFKAYQLIEQLKPVAAQRDALRSNSQEALREIQELEQLRQREAVAERIQQRRQLAGQISDRIVGKLDFIKDFEGVDIQAIVKEVEDTDVSSLPPVKAVYNHIAAELFPKIAREYVKLTRERDNLISKLADYSRATPRVGGQTNVAGQAAPDGLSLIEAVDRHFGG
jgi:hypothetical protein